MKLTIKQALEQGYTHYGEPYESWQHLYSLKDTTDKDIEEQNYVVFSKQSNQPSIDEEIIKDFLIDHLGDPDNCGGRDDNEIATHINGLDFSSFTEKINKEMNQFKYYWQTDIKLITEDGK